MTLTIELPEPLAEFVRAESLIRRCSAGEAALELLGERQAWFDMDDLEASLANPTPGERIPLNREYIDGKIAWLATPRERRANGVQ